MIANSGHRRDLSHSQIPTLQTMNMSVPNSIENPPSGSMNVSLVSLYESAPSSPAKSCQDCHSPSDLPSSLASTSLDFNEMVLLSNNLQCNLHVNKCEPTSDDSRDSSSTLIPESILNHRVNTNPFLEHHSLSTSPALPYTKLEYGKLLSNLRSFESQVEIIESQFEAFGAQLKHLRQNIMQLNRDSCDLIEKLIYRAENHSPLPSKLLSDAQTQTDIDHQIINKQSCQCSGDYGCSISADVLLRENCKTQANVNIDALVSICHNFPSCCISFFFYLNLQTTEMKYRFRKLPAMVKGYLLRRLMQTEKVQQLKRIIKDTSTILVQFKANLFRDGKLVVTHQDILFHQRLCIQLEHSCKEFYATFFETPIAKQMDLILKTHIYKEKRTSSALSQSSSLGSHQSYLADRFARTASVVNPSK